MIEALRWTQTNIAQFGGDPPTSRFSERVPAGEMSLACWRHRLPWTVHRAIAQSGHVRSVTLDEAYNGERQYPMVDRGSWEVVVRWAWSPSLRQREPYESVDR